MSLIDTGIKIFFLLFCKCHLSLMSTVQFTKCCDPNVLWRITSPILLVQNSCSWSKNHVCILVHFSLIQAWPQASLQTPVKQWWICYRVPYHQSLLELWTCSRYILWAAWKLLLWRKAVVWLALLSLNRIRVVSVLFPFSQVVSDWFLGRVVSTELGPVVSALFHRRVVLTRLLGRVVSAWFIYIGKTGKIIRLNSPWFCFNKPGKSYVFDSVNIVVYS